MANLARSTVTIDGTKFDAASCSVSVNTLTDNKGMPEMGSMTTAIRVLADFHDEQNLPNASLKKFFDLANVVTRDKIKEIKIEFWKDENKQDALCSYKFKGWISRFETANPMATFVPGSSGTDTSPHSTINHLLLLDLQPAMNQQNYTELSIGN
jgi:hypothetical protein